MEHGRMAYGRRLNSFQKRNRPGGPVIVPGLVQDTNALSTSTEEHSPIFGSITSYLFEGVSFVQAVFLCMA